MTHNPLVLFGLFSLIFLADQKEVFGFDIAAVFREYKESYVFSNGKPIQVHRVVLRRYKRGLTSLDTGNRAQKNKVSVVISRIPKAVNIETTVQTTTFSKATTPTETIPRVPTPELPKLEVTTLKGTTPTTTQNKRQNIKGGKHKAKGKQSETKNRGDIKLSKKELSGSV